MLDPLQEGEIRLVQFNRLVQELLRGSVTRNTFQPWEVEILLDIDHCDLPSGTRKETLRRYQRAVQRSVEKGASHIFKLSDYLENNRLKRAALAERLEAKTA